MSDFTNPLSYSALDRDEAECLERYGTLQNQDVSFSGIYNASNIPFNFMPQEDTLFKNLEHVSLNCEGYPIQVHEKSIDQSELSTRLADLPKINEITKIIRTLRQDPTATISDDIIVENIKKAASRKDGGSVQNISYAFDDDLLIDSTHKTLSWPCVQIGETMLRSCTLKCNTLNGRETLRISLRNERNTCFKFFHQENFVTEFCISVVPQEIFKLDIIFIPQKVGEVTSNIMITRIANDSCSKCIALYAYGGRSIISLNLDYNCETKDPYLLLNPESMSSTFLIRNIGTDILFFIINTRNSDAKILISPQSGRINAGSNAIINIQCNIDVIGSTLLGNKKWLVKVGEVAMIFGDESSRLRISRLYSKHKYAQPNLFALHAKVLENFLLLPIKTSTIYVNKLKDDMANFDLLYEQGIKEWKVDLVVERAAFDSVDISRFINYVPLDAHV